MAIYPKISDNASTAPNGNIKFDLQGSDSDFDVYKVVEDNGTQCAYLIFVLKNIATEADQNLTINSISGNDKFNSLFTLNYIHDTTGDLHFGKDNDNKITDVAGTNGLTQAQADANASGASGFLNKNFDSVSLMSNFRTNQTSANLIPIYTTSYIIANDIPPERYAAFIAKYHPTTAFTEEDLESDPIELYITNSDNPKVITFNGTAVNTLTFAGTVGTAVEVAGDNDEFTGGSNTLSDQGNLDLGVHPVGYDYGETDKCVKFHDISPTPGNYQITNNESAISFGVDSINITADSYDVTSEESSHSTSLKTRLIKSFKHDMNVFSSLGSCGEDNASDILVSQTSGLTIDNELSETSDLYKNFELSTSKAVNSLINYRSTHQDYDPNVSGDYKHVSKADVEIKTHYIIKNILNTSSPEETAAGQNNSAFVFSITCGFYNKLTMCQDQIDIHNQFDDPDPNKKYFNGEIELDQSDKGIKLSSTDGPMFRDKTCSLALYLRYNNFDQKAETDYYVTDSDFSLEAQGDNSLGLYNDLNSTNNFYPKKYGTFNFTNGGGIKGTSINTTTSGATYGGFSSATDGAELGVKYDITIPTFTRENMFTDDTCETLSNKEKAYGVFNFDLLVAHTGDLNIFRKGLGNHNQGHIKYRLGFLPKFSRLGMSISSSTNYDKYLFYISSGYVNMTQFSSITTRDEVSTFYKNGTSTAVALNPTDFDAANENLEGCWYGMSGMTINQPIAFYPTNSRRYTENSGNGMFIKHNPTNEYIRGSSGDYYSEYKADSAVYNLPDAQYDQTIQKYRAMGTFNLNNSGDYTIHVQNISVGTHNLTLSGQSSSDIYMSNINNLLTPDSNEDGTGDTIRPDMSNSHTPTWYGTVHGGNTDQFMFNGGTGGNAHGVHGVISNSSRGSIAGYNNSGTSTYLGASLSGEFKDLPEEYNENVHTKAFNNFHGSNSQLFQVSFELDPTNTSAYDQGFYYAQILITYYVNDYKNRNTVSIDADGNATSTALSGSNDNYQSRLHCSKFLVRCKVSPLGELKVVDSENDEVSGVVNLPSINLG